MTFNRKLILSALQETFECLPPHSASFIQYMLQAAIENKWTCEPYRSMKTIPNIQQIHRTLKDLWHGGLIVGMRQLDEPLNNNCLSSWVVYYQLSEDIYKNWLLKECSDTYSKAKKAKFGFNLFGGVFDMGLPENEVKPLAEKVKALMQRTHPDKIEGFAEQFAELLEAHGWIKSGIPLPTLTHTAGDKIKTKMTFLANV